MMMQCFISLGVSSIFWPRPHEFLFIIICKGLFKSRGFSSASRSLSVPAGAGLETPGALWPCGISAFRRHSALRAPSEESRGAPRASDSGLALHGLPRSLLFTTFHTCFWREIPYVSSKIGVKPVLG